MSSLIRSTNLWGYPELVAELGGDAGDLLARFGITVGVEHQQDAFVPYAAVSELLEVSAAELGCPDFGLRLSAWQGLDILGPVAVIARNAQNVRGAFEAIGRYLYAHSPALRMSPTLPPSGDPAGAAYLFEMVEPGMAYSAQGYELSLANGARILQMLAGEDARGRRIAFAHPRQGSPASYQRAFGCEVLFDQPWTGFELAASLADRPIDNADAETRRVATRYLEAQFAPVAVPLSGRVEDLIRRLLPTGLCSAEAIAAELGIHQRTLQRRLAEEGLRFADLLERERREAATRFLAEPGLYLSQIAGLLGYAEQSTFNRSFQRWYSTSPGRFRAELAVGDSAGLIRRDR